MKISNAKVGAQIKDKLTGIAYEITEVAVTNNRVTEAVATEIIPEDEEREPKTVTINGQNDITFTTTKWVADDAEYNVAIDDGVLVVNGEPVQMGELKAKKILKQFKGDAEKNRATVIIFTTESELADDDVRSYIPSRDKMAKLGYLPEDVTVVEDSDTRVIYGFSFTKEIEVTEGDKTVKKVVFDRAGIDVLTFDKLAMSTLDGASVRDEDEYDEDEYDEYEDDEYRSESDLQDAIDEAGEKFMGYDFTKAVMAQGDKFLYVPMQVEDAKEFSYVMARVTNRASLSKEVLEVPAELTAVTSNRTNAPVGPAIFSGKGYVKVADFVAKSNKLEGFIYLVDANKDDRNNEYTYVLASTDRQTITVKRVVTQDRGTIVTVE